MKKLVKNKGRIILSFILVLLICMAITPLSSLATDDFETQIASFPESYKPYLRQLHEAHPNWKFEAFFTTLDFNEAVDNECGSKSLISSTVASNVFKSKDIGDYNYQKDYFIEKDGGFVEANRMAVAYYMDPRNFLNEDGIFLFETLSFNDSFTVEAVENVLKGSFMENKKIEYYNSKGELKKMSVKYSEAIFNAGKTYNVNPCYLASKILNEVGTQGSSSVTGTRKDYPGIYNFYNIGAYDGANAIAKGLSWASSGSTYSRPWNTPVKSINGGAEFLAESYIACGQFTGYLQKFNVNPNNTKYQLYDHQYMTNLTGALSQGYSTYVSYVKSGLIDNTYVFSIPVYENMPSQDSLYYDGELADGVSQTASVSGSSTVVRTGPASGYAALTDVSGAQIELKKGHSLTVVDKLPTDNTYYYTALQFPYWYKVTFELNGTVYTGYLPENKLGITTVIRVGIGEYTPSFVTSGTDVDMHLLSFNVNIAEITENNTVKFKKKGTVNIGAYDSLGNFDKVKYVVTDEPSVAPSSLSLTDIKPTSAVLNFTASTQASQYQVVAVDDNGEISHSGTATSSPYIVSGLKSGTNYKIFIRALLDDSSANKVYGPASCLYTTTLPDDTVVNKVTKDADSKITVHWNALSGVDGYEVCTFDAATGTYTKLTTLGGDASSYTVPAEYSDKNFFAVRSFGTVEGQIVYGKYSDVIDITNIPGDVQQTNVTDVTKGGYTVSWSAVEGASYNLYKYNNGTYELYRNFVNPKFKLKKAGYSAYSVYKVVACKKVGNIVYESVPTAEFSATSLPAQVSGLKISTTAIGGKLTWNKVSNATKYQVFVYKENKKKYVRIATVSNNKYTLKGRKSGKALKVQVRAVIETTYGTYYGNAATVSFWTRPEKTSVAAIENVTTSSFTLSWKKSAGADKYILYQYNSKKKKYVKVTETTSRTYSFSSLKAGTTYRFKVKALNLSKGKTVSSNMSQVLYATTNPSPVAGVTLAQRKKNSLTFTWKKVTGANKYQIYMYDSSKKKYVRIDTVEGAKKYTAASLGKGKTYYFKIRAVKELGGKKYYSAYSEAFGFTTKA